MLLKFTDMREKYAVGLRWGVESRRELEEIQFQLEMRYGFALPLKSEDKKNKLRFFALAGEDHDKAVSLAGVLSKQFHNLIFVHRIAETIYWLCVIKNGEVWMGSDVSTGTAGDFVGDIGTIKGIIDEAKEDFLVSVLQKDSEASELIADTKIDIDSDFSETMTQTEVDETKVDWSSITYCSDSAWDDFQSFGKLNFVELLLKASKFKKDFTLRYMETSRAIMQRAILIACVVVAILGVAYYFIHVKKAQAYLQQLAHQKQIQQREATEAKEHYFKDLKQTLKMQWGYNVIGALMYQLAYLPLQSHGWEIVEAVYTGSSLQQIDLTLKRDSFGTVDSFLQAYTQQPGRLSGSNDTGSKEMRFPNAYQPKLYPQAFSTKQLTETLPRQLYHLISYMQIAGSSLSFAPGRASTSRYGVHYTDFALSGQTLWELKKAQLIFKQFPTLIVDQIFLTVHNYDMAWELKGQIYV